MTLLITAYDARRESSVDSFAIAIASFDKLHTIVSADTPICYVAPFQVMCHLAGNNMCLQKRAQSVRFLSRRRLQVVSNRRYHNCTVHKMLCQLGTLQLFPSCVFFLPYS